MGVITVANLKFHKGQVFRRQDNYFYIEAVEQKQPHDILFCCHFDIANKKPVISGIAERVNSNELSHSIYHSDAQLIDLSSALQETISPTEQQQTQINMWLVFIHKLLSVSGGRLSRAVKDIEAAKRKVTWSDHNYQIPSNSTCQMRVKEYDESQNDPRALCPKGYHAMEGASRLSPLTEDLILIFIVDEYLVIKSKEKTNILQIYRNFASEWKSLNKAQPTLYPTLPCKQTFYKRIQSQDRFLVATKRLNKKEKTKLIKQRNTSFIVDRILERVELDAIHIGMGIITENANTRLPKRTYRGRIVLMMAIDVYSRAIIGYSCHIAPKPGESTDLALECFKTIIMPKAHANWPMYGKPQALVTDATTSSTGNVFPSVVQSVGTNYVTNPRGEPWKKPFIERFFSTLRTDFLSQFDTYLGSKQYKNHDHLNNNDSVEANVMDHKSKHCFTEAEFVEHLEDYIVNYYHNNPHRGLLGKTPLEVWNESNSESSLHHVTLPSDHPALKKLGLRSSNKTIHPDGYVRFKNETYASPELKKAYGGGIDKIDIYYSRVNASYISFENKGWHIAGLCKTNYTPSDSLQRSALEDARKGYGADNSTATERKNFKANSSKAAKSSQKVAKVKAPIRKTSKAIDTDLEDAKQQLVNAEEHTMQDGVNHIKIAENPDTVTQREQSDTTEHSHKGKIGRRL